MPEETEAELSHHYHQPRRVEQFGLEAIPAHLKTVRWYDLYLIIINFLINPATILIGGLSVAAGLSFWMAVLAQVGGCLTAFVAYVTIATIGVDYGIPGQVATRMTFGILGAKAGPSFLRILASTYWFAFQTIAGALVIVEVLYRLLDRPVSLMLVSVLFGFGQVIVAVWGFGSLKILSRIAFPLKIVVLSFLFFQFVRLPGSGHSLESVLAIHPHVDFHWALFAAWANGMAAGWIVMITDAADFCRYSSSRADMWFGTLLAAFTGSFLCTFVGAYGAAATHGAFPNFFLAVMDFNRDALTLILVLLVVVLDNWTINVLNLYTGGLSLANIVERLGRFWSTIIVGVLCIALSAAPTLVNGYLRYTTALGNIFAPMAGVLLADYLLIRRGRIDTPALFRRGGVYWYFRGFNLAAFLCTGLGFCLCVYLPTAWLPTITGTLLTGAVYPVVLFAMRGRIKG